MGLGVLLPVQPAAALPTRRQTIKSPASAVDGSEWVDTSGRLATEVVGYYSQVGLRRPSKPPQGGFASPQHAVLTAVQAKGPEPSLGSIRTIYLLPKWDKFGKIKV